MHALILVDLQNDFMPGGALAVPEGDQVVAVANRLIPCFDVVIATQDWHPADHKSFASQHPGKSIGDIVKMGSHDQVLWPDHCVRGTTGAKFHAELNIAKADYVVQKGTNREIDSYSGFFDNDHLQTTGLDQILVDEAVTAVALMGLATDYCVRFTALDAMTLGFETSLILDGCRGVDLNDGDVDRALIELKNQGTTMVESQKLIDELSRGESDQDGRD